MSGGSYGYLHIKDPGEVMVAIETVRDMADRLEDYSPEAAAETREILMMYLELDKCIDRLRDIWKAVEWRDSNDWGDEQVAEVAQKFKESSSQRLP